MTADAAQMTQQKPWLFRPGQSGNPSGRGKRLPAMVARIAADHGGVENLTAASLLMIEQACRLAIKASRTADPDAAVRLSNASARLLGKIERKPPAEPAPEPVRTLDEMRRAAGLIP
jgi:hypothetical protein